MTTPTVLVTGATGKTGAAVVQQLLTQGFPVRAVVRTVDGRSEDLAQRGAEVVVADLFDHDQLVAALRGTRRAYYLPVFHPYMVQSAVAFGIAAREVGLEAVVQLSQWLAHRAHPSIMTRQTWQVDQVLPRLTGAAHTVINPGLFADNFLRTVDVAALLGLHPVLTGQGRVAPVSSEDIARVVAAVLADPEPHAGRTYRPTGPALLTGRDMGAILAEVVGHRVVSVEVPFRVFAMVARQQRIDPLEVSGFQHYAEEARRGTFALDGVTDVVEHLTGTPAESFEATARRYAALPFARQDLPNRLRAALRFSLAPLYAAHDVGRWERRRGWPAAPVPSLAIDDPRWLADHSTHGGPTGPGSICARGTGDGPVAVGQAPIGRHGERLGAAG